MVVGQQSNRLKKPNERGNLEVPAFVFKIIGFFHIKLKLPLNSCQVSGHLQDALLTKLLSQLIKIHKSNFFKE